MKKASPTLSSDKQIDLLIPLPTQSKNSRPDLQHEYYNYQEEARIVSNQLKGNKIYMSQYRQKQQLKTKSSHNHNAVRFYLHNVIDNDYMHVD